METLTIGKNRFKHDGQYALSSFYNVLFDTFITMGYSVEETKYRNKLGPDGSPVEHEISFECRRVVDKYARIFIRAKTLIVGMSKVQAQIDGKPVNRDKGTLELEMKSFVELDYENKWITNPVLNQVRRIYNNIFYKETLTLIKAKAGGEMDKVNNEMKAFFNMQKFM